MIGRSLLAAIGASLMVLAGFASPAAAQDRPLDKSVYILLDTSGSMSGAGMSSAKQALGVLLDRLDAEGDYDVGLIMGSGDNVVVGLGPGNVGRIRAVIDGASASGGNPITSLDAFATRVLPSISSRCHMVVVVTDGNDGTDPTAIAARIRSQCSRVFVVGVMLNDITVLKATAAAGGGRFCNGQESAAIVRCMVGVFKRFNFNESRKACLDDSGFAGLNPAPSTAAAQRMGNRGFDDWNCTDFSTINAQAAPWSSILFRSAFDYRGSRFSRLDLRGRSVTGRLEGANFEGANLASATISLPAGTDGVSLRSADLTGARITGQGRESGCVRRLDLTGTQADTAVQRGELSSLRSINLCDPRLPARFAPQDLSSVRLTGPKTPTGDLTLASRGMVEVALDQATLTSLTVDSPDTGGEDTTLSLNNVTAPKMIFTRRQFRQLDIKGARASSEFTIIDAGRSTVKIANLVAGKVTLANVDRVSIDRAEIQTMSSTNVTKLDMFAAPVRVSGSFETITGEISMRGDTSSINNLRVCVSCVFKSRGVLRFEDMTLSNAAFEGDFTINAVDSSFRNSRWSGSPNLKSAFTRVDISGSRFEKGWTAAWSLGFPKANLNARGTYFCPDCRIQIVDGDDKVDFGGAVIESVIELRSPAMRDLGLVGAKGAALSGQSGVPAGAVRLAVESSGGVSIDRLDLSGTTAHLSMLNGPLECRSCRFDKGVIVMGWPRLTLAGASAREASIDFNGTAGANALRLERGDFSRSKWPSGMSYAECDGALFSGAVVPSIRDTRLDRCRFDGAVIGEGLGGVQRVEGVGVDFSGARFARATIESSSFQGGSFSRAQFDSARLVKANFGSTSFDGARFKSGFVSETVFEGVKFNGPNGPAAVTEMAGVATTLSSVKFINTDFSGLNLAGWNMQSVELSSVSFARADLSRANWRLMVMDDVRFDGATLDNAAIGGKMTGLRFSGAKVDGLSMSGELASSSLAGVTHDPLKGVFMLPHAMDGVDLRRVNLSATILEPLVSLPRLRDIDLHGASVSCSWKSAIDAAGEGVHGDYTYAAYQLSPTAHLAAGTCEAIGVR
jgi:uncharacterized protein YjbI with pentapeptide repeats